MSNNDDLDDIRAADLEPDDGDIAEAPVEAKAPEPEPEPDEPELPKPFEDTARADIYSKAKRARQEKLAEDEKAHGSRRKKPEPEIEPDDSAAPDATASEKGLDADSDEKPAEKPAAPTTKKPEPYDPIRELASGAETVKLRIYGKDVTLSRDDALRRLGTIFSKEVSADQRLSELRKYEQQVREYEAAVRAEASAVSNPRGETPDVAPSKDVPALTEAEVESVVEGFYRGDKEAVTKKLTELLSRKSASIPVDDVVERAAEQVEQRAKVRREETEREQANRQFRESYPELLEDNLAYAATRAAIEQIRAERPGIPLADVVMLAGKQVKDRMFGPEPADEDPVQDQGVALELESRRKKKRYLPPRSAGGASKREASQGGRKTPSSIVNDMRRRRGQPPLP